MNLFAKNIPFAFLLSVINNLILIGDTFFFEKLNNDLKFVPLPEIKTAELIFLEQSFDFTFFI